MPKRLINFRVVLHVIGSLIIINGVLMSLAIPFSLYYKDGMLLPFATSFSITLLVGLFLRIYTREHKNDEIKKREGFLIVAMGWLSMALFGCLPYLISGSIPHISDAFFETMSGFTTTGATILGGDPAELGGNFVNKISHLPESLLFWRSMTQWIGGMGIIVLTVAILPMLGIGGMELFVAEAPGPTKDKIHPRIKETAKRLWVIYLSLTLLETIALLFCGLDFYESINHALTTNSTGGFSTQDSSIAGFGNPAVEYVIVIFMFLAGTNFTLIYFALKRKVFQIRENDEFKWYLMAVVGLTVLLSFLIYNGESIEETIRTALFQVVSIITTTGYATANYSNWGPLVMLIFFLLLFSGASAGSTSGGIKIVRIVLLIKNGLVEFKRRLHPKAVIPVNLNKKPVPNNIIYNLLAFIFLYLFIFTIGSILVTMFGGVEFEEAISAVATSVGNVGPGLGDFDPDGTFAKLPDASKWILSLLMLMGRLELFTVALVMTPYFWRRI
ncbi:TrkH family potassium uptake protein [Parvicella tangerina]|uniref:Trk system potassium uptake protein TrkH n=1 Tax=Parvicella tangerina TaxID=2829795 RepID=A0A916JMD0_9FLAO|nr:TrkH family potassium uptake protein [Parvicella tangerina]CAG5080585.1 Trk system potassium uptake protein TrkH [Parvicella tangerina]